MVQVPKKVADRLNKEVGRFQKVLKNAKDRDVNEADTVTIIVDMFAEVFGFDKYSEVTSEYAIKGTYCDLAIKLEGSIKYLIEIKAIGLDLKENHLRQVVNYGANKGIQWVILTNGINWEIYKLRFDTQVTSDLVCKFDFLAMNPKKKEDRDLLFILCKKGLKADAMERYNKRVQSVNRFIIGAIVQTDSSLAVIRRELKKYAPTIKVSVDEIKNILLSSVLKRDIVEGEAANKALREVKKSSSRIQRKRKVKPSSTDIPVTNDTDKVEPNSIE